MELERVITPTQISILPLDKTHVGHILPVLVTEIYDPATGDLHPQGLYSNIIFGRQGEPARFTTDGIIPLKTKVIHPVLFKDLIRLKGLYKEICMGKAFVVFDEKEKDFVRADVLTGETGFHVFEAHFDQLVFKKNKSSKRNMRIDAIEKHREHFWIDKFIVIPAGLRELEVDSKNRPKEHEVNKRYRSVMFAANSISDVSAFKNDPLMDTSRWSIMKNILAVDDYLEDFSFGKSGFFKARWGSRRVYGSSRNVITAMINDTDDLRSPNTPDANTTDVGIYQFIKSTVPNIHYYINKLFLAQLKDNPDAEIDFIDRKTLKRTPAKMSQKERDKWTTRDGIEKLMNIFENPKIRTKPVLIDKNYYLALIDIDKAKNTFSLYDSIEEVPQERVELVRPITWAEMFFIAAKLMTDKHVAITGRYPITDVDSTYPTKLMVRTTPTHFTLKLDSINPRFDELKEIVFNRFPDVSDPEVKFFDTQSPAPTKLDNAGADFDGDKENCFVLTSDEAVKEIHDIMYKSDLWLNPTGGLKQPITTFVSDLVLETFY